MSFYSSGSAYRGPKEIRYLFIDGGYFRKVIERFGQRYFGGSSVPVDYQLVDGKFVAYGFTKVFYYDCLAPQKNSESIREYTAGVARQEAHFRKLRSLDGWHVVEGVVKGTGGRARQKEVDIQIAVDMLTHSYRRNMHRVSFIAGRFSTLG